MTVRMIAAMAGLSFGAMTRIVKGAGIFLLA
jgi:hypothetical protein